MSRDADRYAAAKSLAGSASEVERVRLGASGETPPEILYFLASDPALTVRAAVATNAAAPLPAAHRLAQDEDARIRALIARKLASLAPGLSADEQERLRRQTYDVLMALVADEAVRVRAALTEILKEMPDVPRTLILALAHDPALEVSEPVILLSPLLTSDDLLALLTASPNRGIAVAVARRPHLTEMVSDAIASGSNAAAVQALLGNRSASIRETTLDALIARAAEHVEWHEPLVNRPRLPPHSARKVSEIVATHLLEALASRTDLDPAIGAELRRRLEERLSPPAPRAPPTATADQGMAEARQATARGRVSEAMLLQAVRRGEARYASALLALAAGVPLAVVERAAALRSAKGLVSLLWKAGFGMVLAGPLQGLLARLSPQELLGPAPSGTFPLSVDEMRWQLDFLGRVVG